MFLIVKLVLKEFWTNEIYSKTRINVHLITEEQKFCFISQKSLTCFLRIFTVVSRLIYADLELKHKS